MQKIEEIISNHLFFKDLNKEQKNSLVKCASIEVFEVDKYIFNAKQDAEHFYLILNGMVSLQLFSHEKGLISLEVIEEGEFLGWSWLFPPYKWHFDAKTIEKTKVIIFDAKALRKIFDQDTELGYKIHKLFSQIIVERLQAMRFKLLDTLEKVPEIKFEEINIVDLTIN